VGDDLEHHLGRGLKANGLKALHHLHLKTHSLQLKSSLLQKIFLHPGIEVGTKASHAAGYTLTHLGGAEELHQRPLLRVIGVIGIQDLEDHGLKLRSRLI